MEVCAGTAYPEVVCSALAARLEGRGSCILLSRLKFYEKKRKGQVSKTLVRVGEGILVCELGMFKGREMLKGCQGTDLWVHKYLCYCSPPFSPASGSRAASSSSRGCSGSGLVPLDVRVETQSCLWEEVGRVVVHWLLGKRTGAGSEKP